MPSRKAPLAIVCVLASTALASLLLVATRHNAPEQVTAPRGVAGPAASPLVSTSRGPTDGAPPQGTPPATPSSAPAETITLAGRVVREERPLLGVAVRWRPLADGAATAPGPAGREVLTGEDGAFLLEGLPAGTALLLEIDEPEGAYRALRFGLRSPSAGDRVDVGTLFLAPRSPLAVRLVGPDGEAVRDARVVLESSYALEPSLEDVGFEEPGREPAEFRNGEHVFPRLPAGGYTLRYEAAGYARQQEGGLSVEVPRERPVLICLEAGGSIAGRVVNSRGEPVSGARLSASASTSSYDGFQSDKAGRFVLDSLRRETYSVWAEAAGYAPAGRNDVSTGTEGLELVLRAAAVLSGKVISAAGGAPIEGADVHLVPFVDGKEGITSSFARTGADGSFELADLPAGRFVVRVTRDSLAVAGEAPQVDLAEGERLGDQVIRMKASATSPREKDADEPNDEILSFFSSGPWASGPARREPALAGSPGRPGAATGSTSKSERRGSISGRVLDSEGNPVVAEVRIEIGVPAPAGSAHRDRPFLNLRARPDSPRVFTDAQGRYSVTGLLPRSDYVVVADHPDRALGWIAYLAVGEREAVAAADIRLADGGAISGRIVDDNGRGVSGVVVSADRDQGVPPWVIHDRGRVTTDAQGAYVIPHLLADTYSVTVEVEGDRVAERAGIKVVEGATTHRVDLALPAPKSFSGLVVDGIDRPVGGARVFVESPLSIEGGGGIVERFENRPPDAVTDPGGRFTLEGLTERAFDLVIWREGFTALRRAVWFPSPDLTFRLRRMAVIAGRVRAAGENAIPESVVSVFKLGIDGWSCNEVSQYEEDEPSAETDGSGAFELHVHAGDYIVNAIAEGFATAQSTPIALRPGERREGVEIVLQPGATIRGRVFARSTNESVEGAAVRFEPLDERFTHPSCAAPVASVAEDGTYSLSGVPAGVIDLVVRAMGYAVRIVPEIPIRAGEEKTVDIDLRDGGRIRGIVTFEGRPVGGADVLATLKDRFGEVSQRAVTDAAGRFDMDHLRSGEYVLSACDIKSREALYRNETVVVREADIAEVQMVGKTGIPVTVRVTCGGEPVADMGTMIRDTYGWSESGSHTTSPGEYAYSVPRAGTYYLMLGPEDEIYHRVVIPFKGGEHRLDVELSQGKLSGQVLDAESGAPVPFATVFAVAGARRADSFRSQIDAELGAAFLDDRGRFTFSHLPPGRCSLLVSAEGYADARLESVDIEDRAHSLPAPIFLEKGVDCWVHVVDPAGRPIDGASTVVRSLSSELLWTTSFLKPESKRGVVVLNELAPGPYSLTVTHPAFAPARVDLQVAAGAPAPVVVLRDGGGVTFRVTGAGGQPAADAEIRIVDQTGKNVTDDLIGPDDLRPRGIFTDGSGAATIRHMNPGAYRAIIDRGAQRATVSFSIVAGKRCEVPVVLEE